LLNESHIKENWNNQYNFGINYNKSYGYLYINKTYIKDDVLLSIASLYGGDVSKVTEALPLCAILVFS